jgi:hypothetical protein
MNKMLNKGFFISLVAILCVAFSGNVLYAAPKKTSSQRTYQSKKKSSTKTYTKKRPYEGYGKKSSANGQPKTKPVKGHVKRTKKGYTYVNPYARSK